MKEIRKTSQFKKDYKRFKNDKEFIKTLMKRHIESDTLLIWFDKEHDIIELVRLGSHSELFGKGRKK